MPLSPSSLSGYEFNSLAEKEVYEAATQSGYFNSTERYLFHSLNMVKTGNKKVKTEIDFVYMDRSCILFFEVKGGQVKFDSLKNQWYVLGGTQPGDPFKQAYGALFYTRDTLLPELFKSKSVPGRLVFGIGVLFPETLKPNEFWKSTAGQMEFDPELIYDYSDHKKNSFIHFIEKIKHYWSVHPQYKNRSGISNKELTTVSKYFRQDLNFRLPVSDLLKKDSKEVQRLTGMQMYILDNLKFNPGKGGIIMGGPGTGKTLLALELLRRKTEEGKQVLFVCYNKNLAEYLRQKSIGIALNGTYSICHLHNIYRDMHYQKNPLCPIQETNEFWSCDLPLQFIRNIREEMTGYYNYLIIDEGQDILNEYHIDALGKLLNGGFDSGNWAIFMDKEFQNIYNPEVDGYFDFFREAYPSFVNVLQLNCRNTVSTIKRAAVQTGFPEMPCLRTDKTWNSEIRQYGSQTDLINKINDAVANMEHAEIERKYITILCCSRDQLNAVVNSNPRKYEEGPFEMPGKINVSTIHSYKGLENKFILICGPNDYKSDDHKQMSLIYIANTRATAQSIFFINNRYHSIIVNRIANLS